MKKAVEGNEGRSATLDENIVLDKEQEGNTSTDSEDSEFEANDEMVESDKIAVVENKVCQVGTTLVNDVTIPEEITEVLSNIHHVMVNKLIYSNI